MRSLAGLNAVVTGAGSGIGREIALRLVERGVRVSGWGRREKQLAEVERKASLNDNGGGFFPLAVDLQREAGIRDAASRVAKELGRISILVNNAGMAEYAPVSQTTTESWDRTIGLNLRAPFLVTREFLPGMLEAGDGHVLMNVSVAGIKAFPGCGAYGASKFGLLGLTRVLRQETLGTGVRVTALVPGATDTPIWGSDGPPRERLMPPGPVADAALWALASDPKMVPEEIVLRPSAGDL